MKTKRAVIAKLGKNTVRAAAVTYELVLPRIVSSACAFRRTPMTTEASALFFDVSKVCRDLEHVGRAWSNGADCSIWTRACRIRGKEDEVPYLSVGTAFFKGFTQRSKMGWRIEEWAREDGDRGRFKVEFLKDGWFVS